MRDTFTHLLMQTTRFVEIDYEPGASSGAFILFCFFGFMLWLLFTKE